MASPDRNPCGDVHVDGVCQVIIADALLPAFKEWLGSRDLHLAEWPFDEGDITTYVIGLGGR